VSVSRDVWHGIGLLQEVEGDLCLWEQSVPELEREAVSGASQYAEEVTFEVADGNFCSISTVAPRWYEFILKMVVVTDVGLHLVGDFVVENVLLGIEASMAEEGDDGIIRTHEFGSVAVFDGSDEYGVTVNLDKNHDVIVAAV
jgi:hypothetical protein